MISVKLQDKSFEIRPVSQKELEAVLQVYQQCEDFLALGPVATASMDMVLKDIEISRDEHGIFCGIHADDGKMIGVVDYVPRGFQGDPQAAFLSLLMIDSSFRHQGIGRAVVEAVENEIRKDPSVTVLLSGVQVNNLEAVQFWQRIGFAIVNGPKRMADQTTVFELRKEI